MTNVSAISGVVTTAIIGVRRKLNSFLDHILKFKVFCSRFPNKWTKDIISQEMVQELTKMDISGLWAE